MNDHGEGKPSTTLNRIHSNSLYSNIRVYKILKNLMTRANYSHMYEECIQRSNSSLINLNYYPGYRGHFKRLLNDNAVDEE